MFERFTDRARQVVVLAQDESRGLRHNYIGTEHLLLGLLREEEGIAARVLGSFDLTVDEVRAQVARIVGMGDEHVTGQIPFTPRAKKTLELALRESRALGHHYIGTEHVLLALARLDDGVAVQILRDFEVDADAIRRGIAERLGSAAPDAVPPRAGAEEDEIDAIRYRAEQRIYSDDPEAAVELRERYKANMRRRGHRSGVAPVFMAGWLLFGVSLGLGVLIGWAIWGL